MQNISTSTARRDIIERTRWDGLASVFARTDRVMTGRDLRVVPVTDYGSSTPSWTDGRDVFLNSVVLDDPTSLEAIVNLTGVNYHEVAHVLWTPRTDSYMTRVVVREGLFPYFNMLEDQRIESIFVTLYPSLAKYFTSMMLRYLAKSEQQWKYNFPLTHGRRYLDPAIREAFEDRYKGKRSNMAAIKEAIDYYRTCTLGHRGNLDEDAALWALREYARLLQEDNIDDVKASAMDDNKHGNGAGHQGEPETEDQAKGTGQIADNEGDGSEWSTGSTKPDKSDKDKDENTDGSGDADDDNEEGNADESGEGQGAGSENGDGSGTGSGTGADGEGDDDGPSGTGVGTGSAKQGLDDQEVMDSLNEQYEDILSDDEVAAEAEQVQRTLHSGTMDIDNGLAKSKPNKTVPEDDRTIARQIAKEFGKARAALDPNWVYGQREGRLDMRQVRRPNYDRDTSRRRWDEGQEDEASVEVVVLIDTSGSMGQYIDRVSKATWTIKRAVESINGTCTVIGYNTSATVLMPRDTKADASKYHGYLARGGTNPERALDYAARIVGLSKAKYRLVMVLTDGVWYMTDSIKKYMAECKAFATVDLFGIGCDVNSIGKSYGFDHWYNITDPAPMVESVRASVMGVMKAAKAKKVK